MTELGGEPPSAGTDAEPSGTAVGAANDRLASVAAVLGFSFALGSSSLILPLLALASGYDAATVGLLTAMSAVSQLLFRLRLPDILSRMPDRTMIVAANAMMVASLAALFASTALPVFIVSELLQGGGRAMFWTATQTHAVRSPDGAVRPLALIQVVANVGTLSGPAIAGILAATSLDVALIVASVGGLLGLGAGSQLLWLAPYPRVDRGSRPRIWRRPGVDLACWAAFSAGGWRSMLSSFVPVALTAAGQPAPIVGGLMAASEAAGMAPAGFLLRRPTPEVRRTIEIAVIVVTLSLAALPILVGSALLAGTALVLGGAAVGFLQALGPLLASQSVAPGEQGEAIAVAGTFRAGALLATPVAVSAALAVVTLPAAMIVAAVATGGPSLAAAARRSRAASAGVVGP